MSPSPEPTTFHVKCSAKGWYELSGVELERRRVFYSGRVQGVGFRWTTMRLLQDLPVRGYVRNLPDGRVELVVEGSPERAEEALRRVRDGLDGYIDMEKQETLPATGEFAEFGIRR